MSDLCSQNAWVAKLFSQFSCLWYLEVGSLWEDCAWPSHEVGPHDGISGFSKIRGNLFFWFCSVLPCGAPVVWQSSQYRCPLQIQGRCQLHLLDSSAFWDHKPNKAVLYKLSFCLWHCVIITEDRMERWSLHQSAPSPAVHSGRKGSWLMKHFK